MVKVVDEVDELEVGEVDVDICCAMVGWIQKSETIVHSRKQEGASEGVAAADWVGGGGKKAAGISWILCHTSDKVLTA